MIRFGYTGTRQVIPNRYSLINIAVGSIRFLGEAGFARGISLDNSGEMIVGARLSVNNNCMISCDCKMNIGNNVMLGDSITIRDNDGHSVYKDGIAKSNKRPIIIGDNVWIASHSNVLKGAQIGAGSVVAFNSLVTRIFEDKNVLLGGNPAVIIQKNISWSVKMQPEGTFINY